MRDNQDNRSNLGASEIVQNKSTSKKRDININISNIPRGGFVILLITGILMIGFACYIEFVMWPDRYITLDRAQEINYLFEAHEKGELELTDKELERLIKEYHKPIK